MREINIVKLRIVCQMYDEEINGRENEKNHRTNINLQHHKKTESSFGVLSTLIRYRLHALHIPMEGRGK